MQGMRSYEEVAKEIGLRISKPKPIYEKVPCVFRIFAINVDLAADQRTSPLSKDGFGSSRTPFGLNLSDMMTLY